MLITERSLWSRVSKVILSQRSCRNRHTFMKFIHGGPKNHVCRQNMDKQHVHWARKVFAAAVAAVAPEQLIQDALRYDKENDSLHVGGLDLALRGRRLSLVGGGKAVGGMGCALCAILGTRLTSGLLSVSRGAVAKLKPPPNLELCEGATGNLPDEDAAQTTERILQIASALTEDDVLIVLISGGGSALLTLPASGLDVKEKRELVSKIARAGADITELNAIRKKLSKIKGGRLAAAAQPAEVICLLLSDIVGDQLHVIASGPTVRDEDPPGRADEVLRRLQLEDALVPAAKEAFARTEVVNFPEENVHNFIIGSNRTSVAAAARSARDSGWLAVEVTSLLTGDVALLAPQYVKLAGLIVDLHYDRVSAQEVRDALQLLVITKDNAALAAQIEEVGRSPRPLLILGGEPTVVVRGTGLGGRSQQLALEVTLLLESWDEHARGARVQLLCGGTDGADGPNPAAGAIAASGLAAKARAAGLKPEEFRDNSDAFNFYSSLCGGEMHLVTGHTGTNVMDIHLLSLHYPNVPEEPPRRTKKVGRPCACIPHNRKS